MAWDLYRRIVSEEPLLQLTCEEDLQLIYQFTWFNTAFDSNREVNNGRGPVDFKVSFGSADKALVEMKLAS